jgi:VWFA-related protein
MPGIRRALARPLAAVALALTAVDTPDAQNPPKQPAARRDPIRVGVELITTSATVRDRRGVFLADLRHDDFELFEDGVKQAIVTFALWHGGRMMNVSQPALTRTPDGVILPPVRPTNDTSGRVFIIFVDDSHLEPANTPRIRQLFDKVASQLIHQGDMFAVVSSGTSSIAIDLTYDRKRLAEAQSRIMGNGLSPQDILSTPVGADGPAEVRHRVHVAFSTVYELLGRLSDLHDRRKVLIYISNGYDLNPFAETRAKQDEERARRPDDQGQGAPDVNPFQQRAAFSDADLVAQLAELTRAANRANVTFYTVDPRGLSAGPDISQPIDAVAWQRYLSRTQDTLRVLAEQTGGKPIVNTNDFEAALRMIDDETSDYYMLGYYSNNPDRGRRRRRIEIKVRRPEVDVRYRTEYVVKPK